MEKSDRLKRLKERPSIWAEIDNKFRAKNDAIWKEYEDRIERKRRWRSMMKDLPFDPAINTALPRSHWLHPEVEFSVSRLDDIIAVSIEAPSPSDAGVGFRINLTIDQARRLAGILLNECDQAEDKLG